MDMWDVHVWTVKTESLSDAFHSLLFMLLQKVKVSMVRKKLVTIPGLIMCSLAG